MLNVKLKKYAYMVTHKDEKGFTMISMLLIITIIFISLPLISYALKIVHTTSSYDELSIAHFFTFLQRDVTEAKDFHISNQTLYLYLFSGETTTIDLYKNDLRRQVQGMGHEIYLKDVESVTYTPLSFGFKIILTSLEGINYEKTIVFYE